MAFIRRENVMTRGLAWSTGGVRPYVISISEIYGIAFDLGVLP